MIGRDALIRRRSSILNRDGPFNWPECLAEDLVICCSACNSSRGQKLLEDWFTSAYCRDRNITADTVAEPIRQYLVREAVQDGGPELATGEK
jgi:hypothetical protein